MRGGDIDMKRTISVLLATAIGGMFFAASASAENYDIGKVAAAELKIGLGPRPAAMGEAFVGKADDLNATFWNPAGLGQVKGSQIGFMHNIYLESTSLEYLAYAQNLFSGAGLGAYVTYFNGGTMDKVDESAQTVGDFTPGFLTASVGYGQWLIPEVALGVSVKFLSERIDTETYSAIAVDMGGLVRPGIEGLQLGVMVQNVGSQVADSQLPVNAKVGVAYVLPVKFTSDDDTWNLLADVNVPFGDTKYTSINAGTEYWFGKIVAARVGYKVKDAGDLGGVTGLTAGAGLKVSFFDIDYALVSFGDLGFTHQIALAASF